MELIAGLSPRNGRVDHVGRNGAGAVQAYHLHPVFGHQHLYGVANGSVSHANEGRERLLANHDSVLIAHSRHQRMQHGSGHGFSDDQAAPRLMTGSLRLNPEAPRRAGVCAGRPMSGGEEMRRMLCAFSFQFSARKYSTEKHFFCGTPETVFPHPETVFPGVPQVIDFKGIRPSSFSMILGALFRLLSQTPTVPQRGRVRPLTAGLPPRPRGLRPRPFRFAPGGSPATAGQTEGAGYRGKKKRSIRPWGSALPQARLTGG